MLDRLGVFLLSWFLGVFMKRRDVLGLPLTRHRKSLSFLELIFAFSHISLIFFRSSMVKSSVTLTPRYPYCFNLYQFFIIRSFSFTFCKVKTASLFTNVPLDFTIEIVLKRIYELKEIETSITRTEMKELLLLCTKNVHFSFDGKIYIQVDGVAMGSPLGPVIANIFMVELERNILPTLTDYMLPWKRYVDDTLSWINIDYVDLVTEKLHEFHENIKFTHEIEKEGKISFLDVLLIRIDNRIETTVFRKKTDTDIYLNWNAFAPLKWKRGTLRTLLLRAYSNCSNDHHLQNEIRHLHHVFTEINGYPQWIIRQEIDKLHRENETPNIRVVAEEESHDTKIESLLVVPYQGERGNKLIKSLVKTIAKVEKKHETKVIYTGAKLSTCFNVKDKTIKEHKNNLVYEYKCQDCQATYIGETARRFSERIKDHCGRDQNSHILRHSIEKSHKAPVKDDFSIIYNNRQLSNYYVRATVESLLIKREKPSLNSQEKSRPLKLFN